MPTTAELSRRLALLGYDMRFHPTEHVYLIGHDHGQVFAVEGVAADLLDIWELVEMAGARAA